MVGQSGRTTRRIAVAPQREREYSPFWDSHNAGKTFLLERFGDCYVARPDPVHGGFLLSKIAAKNRLVGPIGSKVAQQLSALGQRRFMSGEDIISKRAAALENQFFASVDEKLTDALRAELEKAAATKELAKLSGVADEKILGALVDAGVSPTTFPALRLFPLVAVAWADGMLDAAERDKVMEASTKHSVDANSPSGKILAAWLATEPSDELFDAWEHFARSLVKELSPNDALALKNGILAEVHEVAKASGGVLGWSAISKGEHAVENRIKAALSN